MQHTLSRLVFASLLAACSGSRPPPASPPPAPTTEHPPPDTTDPGAPCAAMLCLAPSRCVETDGVGRCVPLEQPPAPGPHGPLGPFCGGIAALRCPGAGTCADDPSDDCDPRGSGRDCGGVCQCAPTGACPAGQRWDAAPSVCACVAAGSGASAGGVPCGRDTCAAGQVCCNASCGICTPPGGMCVQMVCENGRPPGATP